MVCLQIPESIKVEALRHSEERMAFEYNRFGLTLEKRKSMILIGTIGQLMFKGFLEENNINFEFEYQAGVYDQLDFKIADDIIELKTSGYDNTFINLNLLYSDDQFNAGIRKGFRYCVQCFVNGYDRQTKLLSIEACTTYVLAGYIPFESIADYPNQRIFFGDDFKVPLNQLKDISELINQYK